MSRDEEGPSRSVGAATMGDHPTVDQLVYSLDGDLDSETISRVQDHLKTCEECRTLYEDLANYPDLESPGDAYKIGPDELRQTLGGLRARRLGSQLGPSASWRGTLDEAEKLAPVSAASGASLLDRARRSLSLAAGIFLMVTLGWGLYNQIEVSRLKVELGESDSRLARAESLLLEPRANTRVVLLLPTSDPLRDPDPPRIQLDGSDATLVIQTEQPLLPGTYVAEVLDGEGSVVQRIEGLRPRASGLSLYLPSAALPSGRYLLRLSRASGEFLPTSYELRIAE